jgi:hypothetical protein
VKYGSREAVVDALVRLGVGRGSPAPVWPPCKLPYGLFVSPLRNGWVSLWSPLDNVRDWFPQVTATLECPGILLEVLESQFWIGEFFQDENLAGRVELPTEAVAWDDLWARTVDSLEAEGLESPWEDELRFSARLEEIAASPEFEEGMAQLQEEHPEPGTLVSFLPPHASIERAWELLYAIDAAAGADGPEMASALDEETALDAEDYMDDFATYLGIRDAAWNPGADADALSEGDYEDEEGLPEGWREFVVLPVPQLPVL